MAVTLKVEGMSCENCEKAVTEAFSVLRDVNDVKVDLASGNVEIDYNEDKLTIPQLTEVIENQGYDVVK